MVLAAIKWEELIHHQLGARRKPPWAWCKAPMAKWEGLQWTLAHLWAPAWCRVIRGGEHRHSSRVMPVMVRHPVQDHIRVGGPLRLLKGLHRNGETTTVDLHNSRDMAHMVSVFDVIYWSVIAGLIVAFLSTSIHIQHIRQISISRHKMIKLSNVCSE